MLACSCAAKGEYDREREAREIEIESEVDRSGEAKVFCGRMLQLSSRRRSKA